MPENNTHADILTELYAIASLGQ